MGEAHSAGARCECVISQVPAPALNASFAMFLCLALAYMQYWVPSAHSHSHEMQWRRSWACPCSAHARTSLSSRHPKTSPFALSTMTTICLMSFRALATLITLPQAPSRLRHPHGGALLSLPFPRPTSLPFPPLLPLPSPPPPSRCLHLSLSFFAHPFQCLRSLIVPSTLSRHHSLPTFCRVTRFACQSAFAPFACKQSNLGPGRVAAQFASGDIPSHITC